MLRILSPHDPDYETRLSGLIARGTTLPKDIETRVAEIVTKVRREGDSALREFTERFEHRQLGAIELQRTDWLEQAGRASPQVRRALANAAKRIRTYHQLERPCAYELTEPGVRLRCRVTPLDCVGLYIPGGTACLASTVLMTAIPAKVAGVRSIVMTTPGPSPETLAAAVEAGVDRVFLVGGAQAIAALAYGTETVPRVDKIAGPGNAYVTAAKRLVYGEVGIDMIAGPTEVVIAADASAKPSWVAADLLAQAEHDVLAVPILVAVGRAVAEAVAAEVNRQLATLPRREIAGQAVDKQGLAFVVEDAAAAIALINRLAPEHVGLALANAGALADQVTAAGAIFVGEHACEAVGDYFAGPSHVLPTGGSARYASPLGVADFSKRTSLIEYDADALARQGADIVALAEVEGLAGHGRSVSIRTGRGH
jgi:histidinol dehydrogenase